MDGTMSVHCTGVRRVSVHCTSVRRVSGWDGECALYQCEESEWMRQ